MTIEAWILAGAGVGLLVSLLESRRTGCLVLWIVPMAMLIFVSVEMSDPARRPDALDALAHVFGRLWPSLGALAGFLVGRAVRGWLDRRKTRTEE